MFHVEHIENVPCGTIEEYEYCVSRGFEPLLDTRFVLPIDLRIEIQERMFPTIEKFFRWVWAKKPHYCEETMRPLHNYSAAFCSHILSRGAHPEMAKDARNINILCFEMHNKWEFGDRRSMRIYEKNQKIIELLKSDYNERANFL
jgi:hypothetical protein